MVKGVSEDDMASFCFHTWSLLPNPSLSLPYLLPRLTALAPQILVSAVLLLPAGPLLGFPHWPATENPECSISSSPRQVGIASLRVAMLL